MKKIMMLLMMLVVLTFVGCDETSSTNSNPTQTETTNPAIKLTFEKVEGYSVSSDEEWYITYISDDDNRYFADFELIEYSEDKIKEIRKSGCQLGYTVTNAIVWGSQEADENGNYTFYVFDTDLKKVGSFHIYTDKKHFNELTNTIPYKIGWK